VASRADPTGGANSASSVGFKGPSKGKERNRRGREGKVGKREDGTGREGERRRDCAVLKIP